MLFLSLYLRSVNQRIILVTYVLLLLGLLGIGIVQFFWLQKAIQFTEQDFDKNVFQSLYDISNDIENIKISPILTEVLGGKHIHKFKEDLIMKTVDENGETTSLFYKDTMSAEKYAAIREQIEEAMPMEIDNIQQMMAEQMTSLTPIQELLDTTKVNAIIKKALANHGINLCFKFGITEFAPNNFVLISQNTPFVELYKTKYFIELFPRSIIDQRKSLRLYFPDKDKYIYTSIWKIIASSAFFFILTVVAFVLAFQIIFKQKKLSDMKNDFINNMTHELKTPIATISIAGEMLRDNSISSNEDNRKKYANIIIEENKRLGNHVEKVLQIARLENGELELNKADRSINDIIENVANRFLLQLEDLGGEIQLNLNAQQDIFKVDELHFSNMINNLIDNAIKYNDKSPLIKINTFNTITGIVIEVQDNGIGLSKEDQGKIFDKFYRVSKGNVHDVKGFGLGLSYVMTIVEGHLGKISLESKLKEGTKFSIQIPNNQNV